MVLSLMAAIMMAISSPSSESTFTISYSLPVGSAYTYKVVSDQYPIPNRMMRLHSQVRLVVLGTDSKGNRICEFKVSSDTTFDHTVQKPLYKKGVQPVTGHRLYSRAGHIHFLLDMFGNINTSLGDDEDLYAAEVSTQFLEQSDLYITPGAGTNSPYLPQLLMPSMATFEWEVGVVYPDTIQIPSRRINMPTSYGTSGTVKAEVLYDTVYKETVLDSVNTSGAEDVAYMSMEFTRQTISGTVYRSEAQIQRILSTGLIKRLAENCFKRRGDKEVISYSALAELVASENLSHAQLEAYLQQSR